MKVFSSAPFVHPAGVSIGSLVVSVNVTVPFVGSVLSAVICPSGFLVSIFHTLYGISSVFPALSLIVRGPCSFAETTFVKVFSSAPFVHPAGVAIGSSVVSVNVTVPFVGSVLSAVICPSVFFVSWGWNFAVIVISEDSTGRFVRLSSLSSKNRPRKENHLFGIISGAVRFVSLFLRT